jgi:hypothetical protein
MRKMQLQALIVRTIFKIFTNIATNWTIDN